MRTYFWDFFGPRAEGAALAHQAEIDAFIDKHKREDATTGIRVLEIHHHVTWCRVNEKIHEKLAEELKPKRWVDNT